MRCTKSTTRLAGISIVVRELYNDIFSRSILRTIFKIHPHKMRRQSTIRNFVNLVENKIDKIESGEKCRRKIDVLRDWKVGIVFTSNWICRGKDTGSGVEGSDDSGFRNGHGLLFHDFVEN